MDINHKKALKHFKVADPALAKLIFSIQSQGIKVIDLQKKNNYFKALVNAIISQQLSDKVAGIIFKRFLKLFLRLSPKQVLLAPDEKLKTIGLSSQKILYIKNLAFKLEHKEITFKHINKKSEQEIIETLTSLKGIGSWTAEMFLIFSLGKLDVFSPKDLGLQNAIIKLYNLKKTPRLEKLVKISFAWKPYRSYACLYLWASQQISKAKQAK